MNTQSLRRVIVLCVIAFNTGTHAQSHRNTEQSVFAGLIIAPFVVPPQSRDEPFFWQLDTSIVSHSLRQSRGEEVLELDGETVRLGFEAHFQLSEYWLADFYLQIGRHQGGALDSYIDSWHNLTGLPDGQRDQQAEDALAFGHQNGTNNYLFNQPGTAFADTVIGLSRKLQSNSAGQTWLRLGIELPTGNDNKLTGNNGVDLLLSVSHSRVLQRFQSEHHLGVVAAVIFPADELVADNLRPRNAYAAAGLSWRGAWRPTLQPIVELHYASARFDSDIPHLGQSSLGLNVGLRWQLRSRSLQFGISEDLKVDSAPDVGFYLRLASR